MTTETNNPPGENQHLPPEDSQLPSLAADAAIQVDEEADSHRAGADLDFQREENQFVSFVVAGECFAAVMEPVQEIIRVPDLAKVPLAPQALSGLANLRGRVLPIVSLRHILGLPEIEASDSTRALVIDLGAPIGFVVDRVNSVMSIEKEELEPVDGIQSTIKTELLTSVVKGKDGSLTMVLDFPALIGKEFAGMGRRDQEAASMSSAMDATSHEERIEADLVQLVSFEVNDQEYAVPIMAVQEIVQTPTSVVHVPNAPAQILGLMTLRERLLPLVSLRGMMNLPLRDLDETQRVVVLALTGRQSVGVVVDAVQEVLRVPKDLVEPLPLLLAKDGGVEEISSICRLDNGKRLVSVLDVGRMFASKAVQEVMEQVDQKQAVEEGMRETLEEDQIVEDEEQVVVFRLGKEEFGVPITTVQEIVRVPDELTKVPMAPDFVEGIINLRGLVLPVIDQRCRLGLEGIERNEGQRIMVYSLGGSKVGFVVDAVSEVLKILKSHIEAAPKLSRDQARIMGRVANLNEDKRMILLIDPDSLLSAKEMAELAQVSIEG